MRGPKKSETIEIRLPHEAKQAFMARCRAEGVTASQALRAFIEGAPEPASRALPWRGAAVGLALLGLGVGAAPSLAKPSLQANFTRMDLDRDGGLSLLEFEASAVVRVSPGPAEVAASPARQALLRQEFARLDADRNGRVTLAELLRAR